jgi:hypothetical protein
VDFEETLTALLGLVGSPVSVSAAGIGGDPPLALIGHGTLAQGTEFSGEQRPGADLYFSFKREFRLRILC